MHIPRPERSFALLLLALAASACSLVDPDTEPGEEARMGAIAGFAEGDPHIVVADSGRVSETVPVLIRTYGNGCVRKGGVQVETDGDRVTLTPWNYVRLETVCTDDLRIHDHQVLLSAETPREIRLVVRGTRQPSGEVLAVERTVTIR